MASVTLKQKTLLELWQNKSKTALTEGDLWIRLKKKNWHICRQFANSLNSLESLYENNRQYWNADPWAPLQTMESESIGVMSGNLFAFIGFLIQHNFMGSPDKQEFHR